MNEFDPTHETSPSLRDKTRKLLSRTALILVSSGTLFAAACGGGKNSGEVTPSPTAQETEMVSTPTTGFPTPEVFPTEEPTAAPSPDVVTGILQTLTGEATPEGLQLICPQDNAEHPECSNNPNPR